MSFYQQTIRETMARAGRVGAADPRWIEAWMRLEHGCLDGLTAGQFRAEVAVALQCVEASTPEENEALAVSEGL